MKGVGRRARKLGVGRPQLSAQLDEAVLDYLLEERAAGRTVSNAALCAHTMKLGPNLGVPNSFRASPLWLRRFKKRNRVSMRCGTKDSQKVPSDLMPVIREFRKKIIDAGTFEKRNVYNMDQTMSRFDTVPSSTNEIMGTRTVRISSTKATKKGFTVAPAANGAGEKLPALVIFKERDGVLGRRVRQQLTTPANVVATASANGWMTSDLYIWWLKNVLKTQDEQRLLVVDNYRPHLSEVSCSVAKDECNSVVEFIPPGCTGLVQPMDVSANRPFKAKLRSLCVDWFKDRTETTTPRGNLKQPTRQQALDWGLGF